MIKDIVKYNNKEYQVSTVNLNEVFETMIFPIEDNFISGHEVYCFRTVKAGKSMRIHRNILNNPELYLHEDAIADYLKHKDEYCD